MKDKKLTKTSLIRCLNGLQTAQKENSGALLALAKKFKSINKEIKAVHVAYKNLQKSMDELDDDFMDDQPLSDAAVDSIMYKINILIQKSATRFGLDCSEDKQSLRAAIWAKFNALNGGVKLRDLPECQAPDVFNNIKKIKDLIIHQPESIFGLCNWWKELTVERHRGYGD